VAGRPRGAAEGRRRVADGRRPLLAEGGRESVRHRPRGRHRAAGRLDRGEGGRLRAEGRPGHGLPAGGRERADRRQGGVGPLGDAARHLRTRRTSSRWHPQHETSSSEATAYGIRLKEQEERARRGVSQGSAGTTSRRSSRIEARWVAHPQPKAVEVPKRLGQIEPMRPAGTRVVLAGGEGHSVSARGSWRRRRAASSSSIFATRRAGRRPTAPAASLRRPP